MSDQIRDEILHKLEQLKRDMIAASSTPHGGSGRPRGVQIDSKEKFAACFMWGQGPTVNRYPLPKLGWLFDELIMRGVPNLPQWPGEPQTESEALGYLNALLACCDAPPPVNDGRLTLDRATLTVTLDGKSYTLEDPTAFLLYKVIVEAEQPHISGDAIRSKVHGLNGGKAVKDRIDSLPAALRQTVKSARGRGYWFQLPPEKIPK